MSKGLRRTGIALTLVAVLVAATLLFARQLVEFAASTAIGREVQIAGAFAIDYSPALEMQASKVTVSNPEWSERPNMLSVESLTVRVDLRALLHGRLVLPQLRLASPMLILEKTAQGPANWQFGSGAHGQKSKDDRSSWLPSVEHLHVNNGQIHYYRSGKDLKLTATIDTLEARAAHGQPVSVSASGRIAGMAYRLAATGAPTGSLMRHATAPYPFSLHISTAPMEIHASGKLGAPLTQKDSDIQCSIQGSSLARLLPGESPAFLNRGYKAKGRLQGGGEKWTLSRFHAQSGKTELQGTASLDTTGNKPRLHAMLEAPAVDLDMLEALASAWQEPGGQASESVSLASAGNWLDSVNARLHLSVDRMIGNSLPLRDLVMDATLTDGELSVNPLRVAVGDGAFSATLELNAAGPSHAGKIAMRFDQLPVGPLLALLPYDVKQDGRLNGRLTIAFAAGKIGAADGHVRYEAASGDTRLKLVLDRVEHPGQERLVHLAASGRLRGMPAKGRFVGQPIALLEDAGKVPVSLDVALGNYRLQLEGSAADRGSTFDLKLAMSGPGTGKLSRITGVALPELPGYEVKAHLSRNRGLVTVDSLQARVGQSRLSGSLAMHGLRSPEMVRADLAAQTLAYADFDQLMKGDGDFPDLTKWLARTDATIRFAASHIIGPKNAVFSRVLLDASLRDGRLHVAALRFAAGGGKVNASATVNSAASGQPTGSLHARVEHVRLSEALKPFDLGRRFPGVLDADIDFSTEPGKEKNGDSTIRYRDAAAGTDLRLAVSSSPEQTAVKARGRFQHEPFRADGAAGPATDLVSPKPYPFEVDFKALDTSGHLAGTFDQPLRLNQLKSTLVISGPNPRRAESVVGFRMPELPPYRLAGTLTMRNQVWRFSHIKGEVGNSDLSGWIRVDNSHSKPHVESVLRSEMLDFDDLGGLIGAAPGDGPGEITSPQQKEKARRNRERSTVLPDEEFEFPSFLGFNANVRYTAARVQSDKLPIESMKMTFRVRDGRLHLAPMLLGAGGGTVRMDLHLVDRPGERPVRGRLSVDISRVSAGRLLNRFAIAENSAGLISGHGQFRTSGESVAAMMGSLNGEASLAMPDGQLNARLVEMAGLDAGEALLLSLKQGQTVDVNCAYISAKATDGVLAIDTGLIDTTDTTFALDGTVHFGNERIDMRLLAHPKDVSLFSVRAPLILEGTFWNPDFHPAWTGLLARGAAALALGAVAPPAALLAFVEPGMGEGGMPCQKNSPY